jgi:hypothetical protein
VRLKFEPLVRVRVICSSMAYGPVSVAMDNEEASAGPPKLGSVGVTVIVGAFFVPPLHPPRAMEGRALEGSTQLTKLIVLPLKATDVPERVLNNVSAGGAVGVMKPLEITSMVTVCVEPVVLVSPMVVLSVNEVNPGVPGEFDSAVAASVPVILHVVMICVGEPLLGPHCPSGLPLT